MFPYAKIMITRSPRVHYASINAAPIEGWHSSTFEPIPKLRRDDADTHLMAIHNNGLRFYGQNNDPLFAANQGKIVYFDNNSNLTMYTADKSASILGCAEQVY